MHSAGTAPRLLSVTRLTTLVVSTLVSLSSGSNYVVSVQSISCFHIYVLVFLAYLPQLGSRLHLTHTQLNVFAVAGNVGMYTSGLFWGRVGDARGPRPLLVGAFIFLLTGYSGIRGLFDAGLGKAPELSQFRLVLLVMCSFFTGVGGNAGMMSAINATAKSFPDHIRAIVLGIVMSAFGLSAFFFSSISHVLFPGNASDFLLILGLGTALPMVLGFFFVRPIPLPSHGMTTVEAGSSANYRPLSPSADPGVFQDHGSSSTRLVFQAEEDEEVDTHESVPLYAPRPHTLPDSVEPSQSPGLLNRRHVSASPPPREPPSKKVAEGRGVDLHRWSLWKSIDFWIVCFIHILLGGTGLMYINNVGAIAQALFAHGNAGYEEAESSAWQAAQVSVISLANCLGRILIGITADAVKSRAHVPRSFCIPLVSTLFIFALLLLIVINDVHHLWAASGLVGLAYGCWFGLLPTISIEWFGLAHFSENWGIISVFPVIGGNLFSLAFGRNLDAHDPTTAETISPINGTAPSISAHQCLAGRKCYVQSLYLNLLACTIALALSVWAGRRDWSDWQRRLQQTNVVDWEAAEEVAESDGLDP
ncbi:major facilitator superfamily domain-containing protein [Lactarius psammicola]|nr:major facilitator superfamily domain-containing protein [Lactarius psammicola]